MGTEDNHFTKDEILNYLNIDFDFDKMVEIDIHLRSCKTCKSLSKKLESESNRKQRNIQFDQETEIRRNLIIKKKSGSKSGRPVLFILIALVIASLSCLAYYNSELLINRKITNGYSSLTDSIIKYPVDNYVQSDSVHFELANTNEEDQNNVDRYGNEPISTSTSIENKVIPRKNDDEAIPEVNRTPIIQTQNNKPIESNLAVDSITIVKNTPEIIEMTEVNEPEPEIEIPASKGTLFATPNKANQALPSSGYDDFNIYVERNFSYPEEAKLNRIEGVVIVEFMVSEGGNITDTKIIKRLGYGCDEFVIGLLRNSPAWKSYIGEDFVENKRASVQFTFKL